MKPSANLDHLTKTFSRDKEYFDALIASPAAPQVCQAIVYWKWSLAYWNTLQEALHEAVGDRFVAQFRHAAGLWTLSTTGQIARDIGLVPYLMSRGIYQEAATPVRRCLENIGLLAHFWRDPKKAEFLGDRESRGFKDAFVREKSRSHLLRLQAAGITKRFEALHGPFGEKVTMLYEMVSEYGVHGASPSGLVHTALEPTAFSCGFANRLEPTDKRSVSYMDLLAKGIEMTLAEFAFVVGTYAQKSIRVLEAGKYFNELLCDPSDPVGRLFHEIDEVRSDLIGHQEVGSKRQPDEPTDAQQSDSPASAIP
jgi:hypothetical protein